MSNYNQLTFEQRCSIYSYLKANYSKSRIAKLIGVDKSTISREIKRNSENGIYDPKLAEIKANARNFPKDVESCYAQKYDDFNQLFDALYDKRCCGVEDTILKISRLQLGICIPSKAQVYRWIKSENWIIKPEDKLREKYIKGGRLREQADFSLIHDRKVLPITLRPHEIKERKTFGHYELDLINGTKGNFYAHLMVLVERKTRKIFVKKLQDKNPWTLVKELFNLIKENHLKVLSITIDNGIEFKRIGRITTWVKGCKVYYCNPYASWERGTIEVMNGIIRRFFPKGTNFTDVSNEELSNAVERINSMNRKVLGNITSNEAFEKEISSSSN